MAETSRVPSATRPNVSDTPTPGHTPTDDTPDDTPRAPGGPTLSLGEAVRRTGVARSTLQRRLAEGAIPGAERTPAGGWSIPYAGLIAAGLEPRTTPPDPPTITPPAPTVPDETAALRADLERTRAELAHARALADERGRHVDDLRSAIEAMSRALPAGPPPAPPTPSPDVVPARRPRWWHRAHPES